MIVSFENYELAPRFDGILWTKIRIYEAVAETGPWTFLIDELPIPHYDDPADPTPLSFSTDNGTGPGLWYKVVFVDDDNNGEGTLPVLNSGPVEIMADLDDINANLDGEVVRATAANTTLVQVSVARIIRAYLGGIIDQTTLMSWNTPTSTPDTVREIASMLIASQVYFNYSARTSLLIEDTNFAQRLYDRAMALLQGIVAGTIDIGQGGGTVPPVETIDLGPEDFFPVDATDRAFTLSMEL